MFDVRALKKLPQEEFDALTEGLNDEELNLLKEAMEAHQREMSERLQGFNIVIAEKRAEAIKSRKTSGIEQQWIEDEEYYEGIDEATRGLSDKAMDATDTAIDDDEGTGSTIFLNITRPYCDAAGASMADMLLPAEENASWQIKNTPVPELIPIVDGNIPPDIRESIRQDVNGDEQKASEVEDKMIQQASQMLEESKEKAERAQKRIEDWHVECQYTKEVRAVIEDISQVGSGVLKGPVPQKRKQVAYIDGNLVVNQEIKPGSKRISYWNLYPAPGCGENIHEGPFIFERDDISTKKLRELIGLPGYLDEEILAVLDEGPTEAKEKVTDINEMKRDTSSLYEIWYFHGEVSKDELESVFDASGYECECDGDVVHAQVTMVNNRVIRAVLNPLDTGDFPYDVMVWQKRKGLPWGIGVSRQIRTPQRMINGAARNLMDNAGLAGGPMWGFNEEVLTPIDGIAELAPRKGWRLDGDSNIDDIRKAFTFFTIDMMVEPLQAIIHLGLKMAEDVTGLPMIMQGQMGAQRVDTLGQTQILNNNANIVRRRIARLFDDLITEPHIRRYYAYLLQYGDDAEKGEFVIDAKGSSNLVERAILKEKTMELLKMAENPKYGIDPKKAMKEFLRSERYTPETFEYDDEEWKQIVERLSQPPQDPRVEIEQLRAQVAEMREAKQTERTQMELQAKHQMNQEDNQVEMMLKEFGANLEKELLGMKLSGGRTINNDTLKVKINDTMQKLMMQARLAGVTNKTPQVMTPPTEPPQHAPNGMAFQQ